MPSETRPGSSGDFRSVRRKLPPEAFAIGPEQEPAPTDLIDTATWDGITDLPDDVSLRTTDHHGTTLRNAYELWSCWPGLTLDLQSLVPEPREDALCLASITVSDELQSSLHAALTGYYRQAIAGLRPAMEATMAGAYFRAFPNLSKFTKWADGHEGGELWMREMRRALVGVAPYARFEGSANDAAFLGKSGWVNLLYQRLSTFSHGRPQYTDEDGNRVPTDNVGLWGGSNGPVYEPRSVRLWSAFYFDVGLISLLLTGLAEPRVLRVERPNDLPYYVLLERLLSWHLGPPPIARKIVGYLATPGG
jgi:hypothetical protein